MFHSCSPAAAKARSPRRVVVRCSTRFDAERSQQAGLLYANEDLCIDPEVRQEGAQIR